MGQGTPRLLLETSEALTYLNAQDREDDVGRLLVLAEEGRVTLEMAAAGWDEIQEADDEDRARRLIRLRTCVAYKFNVGRIGSARIGSAVIGSNNSPAIDRNLPDRMTKRGKKAGNISDRDQFLSFETGGYDYFVVSDKAFTQHQTRELVSRPLGLHGRIGNATQALAYLVERWSITTV